MPATAAVNIITGTPFSGSTPTNGTSTIVVPGNQTSNLGTGAIIVVTGTGTSNDGYYTSTGATPSGGNTNVTVVPYTTGTSNPGTTPFVSSGPGTVLHVSTTPSPSFPYAILFATPGSFSWTAPAGVTTVAITAIGGGGGSGDNFGSGGGGAALVYASSATVIPGNTYTVVVGAAGAVNGTGGQSKFQNAGVTLQLIANGGVGGTTGTGTSAQGGGGGAGGYGGAGGNSGSPTTLLNAGGAGGTFSSTGVSAIGGNGGHGGGSDTSDENFSNGSNAAAGSGGGGGGTGGFNNAGVGGGTGVGTSVPGGDGIGGTFNAGTRVGSDGTPGSGGSRTTYGGGAVDNDGSGSVGGPGVVFIYAASGATSVDPPSNLVAVSSSATSIDLSWDTSHTIGVTYNVYQGTSSGGESGTAVQTGISVTGTTITGLTTGTPYYFKVKALSGSTLSTFSNEDTATPTAATQNLTISSGSNSFGPFSTGTGPYTSITGLNGDGNGSYDGSFNTGQTHGTLPGTLFGQTVNCIAAVGGVSGYMVVALTGTVAQSFFSSMTFTDASSNVETFNTASATSFSTTDYPGFSIWYWPAVMAYPFGFGADKVVTFTQ